MRAYKNSVVLSLFLLAVSPLYAQGADEHKEPIRPWRSLVIGNVAFLDSSDPIFTGGFLYQIAASKTTVQRDTTTDLVITPNGQLRDTTITVRSAEGGPTIYFHSLASAGIRGADRKFTGFLQLGIMKRTEHTTFKVLGIAAQGVLEPLGVGPVARLEIKDNLGIQTGWIFYEKGSGGGFFLAVDFYKGLWKSLGF